MKYTFQWKDPDMYYVEGDDTFSSVSDSLSDEEYEKLRELGFGEYLVVEFDTTTMTATVTRAE